MASLLLRWNSSASATECWLATVAVLPAPRRPRRVVRAGSSASRRSAPRRPASAVAASPAGGATVTCRSPGPWASWHHDPAMDLFAELEARGLVQDSTDREALAARLASGPIGVYVGFDPTADSLHVGHLLGQLDVAPVPAGRSPPVPAGRRRHRHGRRPRRSQRGAQPARPGDARPQHRGHQGAARAPPRLRARAAAGHPGRQRRLDRADRGARLPPRRRQAHDRQPDGGQGLGPAPHGERARDLLHRVQLHAAPGQRLPVPLRAPRRRAADGRLGPVGQHHDGHRPHPAHARADRPRADLAPPHAPGRRQDGQDRRRCGVARPRPDRRRTSSASSGCRRRTRRSVGTSGGSACGHWTRWRT